VINKSTEVGAWIARGDPVAEIVELDEVDFAFNVSQDLVVTIQQALADSGKTPPVVIKIEGVETELLGQLLSIVPQVDLRSRLATVRARVVNPTAGGIPILKPGMLGRALIAIGSKRSMRVISRDALVLGGQKPVVYKVISRDNKNIVVPIQVTLGSNLGDWVEVIGDLQDGDRVIVEGNERLRANAEVEISKSRPDKPSF
jgi:RND family efflux transporter MFP subunit